jgi:hypothetical protein
LLQTAAALGVLMRLGLARQDRANAWHTTARGRTCRFEIVPDRPRRNSGVPGPGARRLRAAPMRSAEETSAIWQTGHSEETHSPDECARMVVRRRRPVSLSISVDWMVAISCRPRLLRIMSRPLDSGA